MELPPMVEAYIGALAVTRCGGVEAVEDGVLSRLQAILQSEDVNFGSTG